MVNDFVVPVQVGPEVLVKLGVTAMVVDVGDVPAFKPVNAEIFPVPVAADKPIAVLLFVQEYVVPVTVVAKFIAPVDVLLHTIIFEGSVTLGTGFTVAITVCVLPVQVKLPLVYVGVMV